MFLLVRDKSYILLLINSGANSTMASQQFRAAAGSYFMSVGINERHP